MYVLAGIYYGMEDEQSELTGYVRLGGELDILGLISVSLEFYLGLSCVSTVRSLMTIISAISRLVSPRETSTTTSVMTKSRR